jgi:hypothetical protein
MLLMITNGTFHRQHKFVVDNNLSLEYGNICHLQAKQITKI